MRTVAVTVCVVMPCTKTCAPWGPVQAVCRLALAPGPSAHCPRAPPPRVGADPTPRHRFGFCSLFKDGPFYSVIFDCTGPSLLRTGSLYL